MGTPGQLCRQLFFAAAILAATLLRGADKPAGPSDEECTAFGRQVAQLVETGRAGDVVGLLDISGLLDRITTGLVTGKQEQAFRAGMQKGFSTNLAKQYDAFISARFVRLQHVDNETRALVRLVSQEGAVNYTAYICSRRPNGPIQWKDAYLYLSGETMSQTSRRTALPLLAEEEKGLLDRLLKSESAYVANFEKVHQAMQAFRQGDSAKVWQICEKLPAEVQRDRTILVLRLRAAQALDDAKYLKVITDWAAAFPNDSTLDFVSIDGAIMRKDYPAALKHIAAFSQQVGGDTYLDFLTGNVLVMAKRYDEARKKARGVLAAEPTLTDAFDTLLSISLETKNYAETVSVLDEVQQRFPTVDVDADIAGTEPFAEFRLSKTYLDWRSRRKTDASK